MYTSFGCEKSKPENPSAMEYKLNQPNYEHQRMYNILLEAFAELDYLQTPKMYSLFEVRLGLNS